MKNARWHKSRQVVERVIVEGTLTLETPARFGGGDSDGLTDMPLALDPLKGRALLTGSSLAGALRSYLREREPSYGEGEKDHPGNFSAQLFGRQEDTSGEQSPLITYDALGNRPSIELRDGVAIDPKTRTAEDKKKYDFELIDAGATFPLCVELLVTENERDSLLRGLAIVLQGLERGEIPLGGRKRRGFGQCRVGEWHVRRYDLTQTEGLIGWLTDDHAIEKSGQDIAVLLNVSDTDLDERQRFLIKATFALDTSLLIRSGFGKSDAPDFVHLHSKRNGQDVPILSGTSLAGALRARALRIVNTLTENREAAWEFTDRIFGVRSRGKEDKRPLTASHLIVHETEIGNPLELVQSRVKIDRFTGGSFPTALFSEQPVFGRLNGETTVTVKLELRQPADAEIGLMLLLVKDLWTGDLPLGGEVSVGRGRLRGIAANLEYGEQEWRLSQKDKQLEVSDSDKDALEGFVQALREEVAKWSMN